MILLAFFLTTVLVVVPRASAVSSLVVIRTMFDPEGPDTGREWIEMRNTGDQLNIEDYRLRESGTDHRLKVISGGKYVANGMSIVIVDSTEKYFSEYGEYAGVVVESSFSLANTSETLAIIDANGATVTSWIYDVENNQNGCWVASSSEPDCTALKTNLQTTGLNAATGAKVEVSQAPKEIKISKPIVSQELQKEGYFARAKINMPVVLVDNEIEVAVELIKNQGTEEKKIKSGVHTINFGDGTATVLSWLVSLNHTYRYPGKYILVYEYSVQGDENKKAYLEKIIDVYSNALTITTSSGNFGLTNNSDSSIDISGMKIGYENTSSIDLKFKKNSMIAAQSTLWLGRKGKRNIQLVSNIGRALSVSQSENVVDRRDLVESPQLSQQVLSISTPDTGVTLKTRRAAVVIKPNPADNHTQKVVVNQKTQYQKHSDFSLIMGSIAVMLFVPLGLWGIVWINKQKWLVEEVEEDESDADAEQAFRDKVAEYKIVQYTGPKPK